MCLISFHSSLFNLTPADCEISGGYGWVVEMVDTVGTLLVQLQRTVVAGSTPAPITIYFYLMSYGVNKQGAYFDAFKTT